MNKIIWYLMIVGYGLILAWLGYLYGKQKALKKKEVKI